MTVAELIAVLETLNPKADVVTVDAAGGVTAITGADAVPWVSHASEPRDGVCVNQDLDETLGWEAYDLSD